MNNFFEAEKVTIATLKMLTNVPCWWENLSKKKDEDGGPIKTWKWFFKHVRIEFYPSKYHEQ